MTKDAIIMCCLVRAISLLRRVVINEYGVMMEF